MGRTFVRKFRRFYQKAEPIAGPRVSFTKTARAIIRAAEQIAVPGVIDLQIHDEPSQPQRQNAPRRRE